MIDCENSQTTELLNEIVSLRQLVVKQAEQIELQTEQIELQTKQMELQAEQIEGLLETICQLKKRLSKNSQNSSNPPSSDKSGKKEKNKSSREKSHKKKGGQFGHKGETLKQAAKPNKVVRAALKACPNCHGALGQVAVDKVTKRQVFDIPPPEVQVTEYQVEVKTCPKCFCRVSGKFPKGVNAPAQYGPALQSIAVYLSEQQLLPEKRLQQTFSDLFKVDLATSTLKRSSSNVYHNLEKCTISIYNRLKKEALKHLDETGFRIKGKTQWLHVMSNKEFTYYYHSPKRKCLLTDIEGIVVHDHWKSYYQLEGVKHVLCNAHHLRELKSLMEDKEHWAAQMWRFLRFAVRLKNYYGNEPIPKKQQDRLLLLYDQILQKGFVYHESLCPLPKPKRGRQAKRPGHNLLVRLRDYRSDATRFIKEVDVPFTNNQAERDLRMMKVKEKISGGFRSDNGADVFVRIRSFISTARKQGWNIFDCISQAISGEFLLPFNQLPG